jgi:hypothetical protein
MANLVKSAGNLENVEVLGCIGRQGVICVLFVTAGQPKSPAS